jgi:hypothetical protein
MYVRRLHIRSRLFSYLAAIKGGGKANQKKLKKEADAWRDTGARGWVLSIEQPHTHVKTATPETLSLQHFANAERSARQRERDLGLRNKLFPFATVADIVCSALLQSSG